jgi:colanic acid/amylovoran biosynthesis glycosyltransferase
MTSEATPPGPRLAYLLSSYPLLSESFVLKEVVSLRALGFDISVASVNRPDRPLHLLGEVERREADMTYYLKARGWWAPVRAHLRVARSAPEAWLRGWRRVIRLAGFDLRRLLYSSFYFTEALMVGTWMQDRALSHVHTHLGSQASTVGMFVKDVFSFGWSVTIHGPDEFYDASGQHLTEKMDHVDFAVCISDFTRSQLMRLSEYERWTKYEVCRLGVDTAQFHPPERRDPRTSVEILCVGRLTPAKGQHLLLESLSRLVGSDRSPHLRFIGGGPDEGSLRDAARRLGIESHVTFEGPVNHDRVVEFYRRADIFCLPSFAEGLPVALMEAMAMELPCVSTRITGIPELVEDGVTGLLVSASNVEQLADALRRLIDDDELRRRLGRAGRERVTQHYELSTNTGRLAGIFRRRLA